MRYSMDLRQKVVEALDAGQSIRKVAKRFAISKQTVQNYKKQAANGSLQPRKPGPKQPAKLTEQDHQTIHALIAEKPGITLKQLMEQMSVPVAECTMSRTLKRLGYTSKKRHVNPASNSGLMYRKSVWSLTSPDA